MSTQDSLLLLEHSLASLRRQQMAIPEFCRTWRAQSTLLEQLPPRYAAVLEDLLGRMEAGSPFTEESCSFSQTDLQDGLSTWLDKARQTLAAQA